MNAQPSTEARLDCLKRLLFDGEAELAYAILDGASIPGLLDVLSTARDQRACLYRGELKPDLAARAPYLVHLRPDSPLTDWILSEGWGQHWGVFAKTPANLEILRRHFRTLLRVRDHSGKVLYFRFYDPRVLTLYLPTCNRQEIKAVYGPVTQFVAEDEKSGRAFRFARDPVRIKPAVVDPSKEPAT